MIISVLLLFSVSFLGGALIFSCFLSYCKNIGEYFVMVSTSDLGLADWEENY